MGIPSYYKRLSNSIKGLVVRHRNDGGFKVNMLLFDFNCMIYQIIRSPDVPPFPGYGHSDAESWEDNICQRVVDYTVNVWNEVGRPKKVFIGIDGVVPMAKIRQQRLRRFKSIWTANEEVVAGVRAYDENRWDTNAITPGTVFMERLGRRLAQLCKTHGWILSDASEPGEGEQKCMDFWRRNTDITENIVIYGLDADLILLCLLTKQLLQSQANIWCIRESAEWESGKGKEKANDFMRLSIDKLFTALHDPSMNPVEWTLDYVAAMNFLGNDFVPHGITMKIREGGHDQLIQELKELHQKGIRVTVQENGLWTYSIQGMTELAKRWSSLEEKKLLDFIRNKHHKINYEDSQMLPCVWAEESKVLCESQGKLWGDWEKRMTKMWFGDGVLMNNVCEYYAYGLQWTLDYYTAQREIDTTWIYPWALPPSWKSWLSYCQSQQTSFTRFQVSNSQANIQPQEQLAMVLPLESWHFLRDPKLRELPIQYPQFWPKKFSFFSAGKIFLWECEAELPLLHLATVRSTS